MKAGVLSVSGSKVKEISLPKVFETPFEPALIKRAVLSIQSAKRQPKGVKPNAGRNNTATYIGRRGKPQFRRTINVGRARKPRLKNRRELLFGRVASVPEAVGGPKAHPPKTGKTLKEKINKKEKKKALESAIAATAIKECVKKRNSWVKEKMDLPLVVEAKFEGISKTKEVNESLSALHLLDGVENAKKKRQIRAGKGKKRGRKYKKRKSFLVVTGGKAEVFRAARNLEGVEVVEAGNLNAELLAPGAEAGRLTLWTENALNALKGKGVKVEKK